ncbi:MetS family NSS transporter small subunit [Gordonia phosphorivorans]|uniref:MetS family NSS transporter small subunit n=1 Tax=Gordonia phosphorivorans TaxID=1056982 RepID=A0ABV6H5C7_9ACTN
MTGPAIALLVVAILLVWGGLVGSISFLRARAEVDPTSLPPLPDDLEDAVRQDQPHPMRDT